MFFSYDNLLTEAQNDEYLFEETNYSVPLVKVKKYLSEKYNLCDWQFEIKKAEHNIEICIIIADLPGNADYIKRDMKHLGYFQSGRKEKTIDGKKWAMIRFEPRFRNEENNIIRECEYLYHITNKNNIKSILEKGLELRSENKVFSYPSRIYFFKSGSNISDLNKLHNYYKQKNGGDYVLLTIDVSKVDEEINFYLNPNYEPSVFTEQPIPSDAIIKIEDMPLANVKR